MSDRPIKFLTLCIVLDEGRILLGMKKRGFGSGKWNGFGGKIEDGETSEEAAKRELLEEAGIIATDIKLRAQFEFHSVDEDADPTILAGDIYVVSSFTGTPEETCEMRPEWFDIDSIPYHAMWSDDKLWLPRIIQGDKLLAVFKFDNLDNPNPKVLEADLVPASEPGYPRGAVLNYSKSPLKNPKTGEWTNREEGEGQFTAQSSGGTFNGVCREDECRYPRIFRWFQRRTP